MKNLKVSAKLLVGFGIANAFTLIVGLASIFELGRLGRDYSAIAVLIVASVGFSVFLGLYISGLISKPLGAAVDMITEMGKGHLSGRLGLRRGDEIGVLAKAMDKFAEDLQVMLIGTLNRISDGELTMELPNVDDRDELGAALRRIVHPLRELIIDDGGRVLRFAAQKDLSHRLTGVYRGDFARMRDNINAVVESLDGALGHVAAAVGSVSEASGEIAGGSESLARGANEQAGLLEEAAANLEAMSRATKRNAENSNQAKVFASEARAAANGGDAEIKRMAEAINQIKRSSDNTAKIIRVINSLAFQTNLLAINAAVEAARAGEAGKGFAVVAGEVRDLALRSAEAAKKTAAAIEESVKSADAGVKIAEGVAASFTRIVDGVGKVGGLIAEIAAASNEQAAGIEQVNGEVARMSQVTQRSAADSEESAGAAQELNGQARELTNLVSGFRLSAPAERYSVAGVAAWAEGVETEINVETVAESESAFADAQQKRQPRATHYNARAERQKHHSLNKPARAIQAKEIVLFDEKELEEILIDA